MPARSTAFTGIGWPSCEATQANGPCCVMPAAHAHLRQCFATVGQVRGSLYSHGPRGASQLATPPSLLHTICWKLRKAFLHILDSVYDSSDLFPIPCPQPQDMGLAAAGGGAGSPAERLQRAAEASGGASDVKPCSFMQLLQRCLLPD